MVKTRDLVAYLILAFVLGSTFNNSHLATYHVVQLACAGDWDNHHHCLSINSVESELYVSINSETHTERDISINPTGPTLPTYRDDCQVLDNQNWECSVTLPAIGKSEPITNTEGMDDGVYYLSITNDQPPNFYNSSISWHSFLLYHWRIITLKQAVSLSKYL